MRLKEAVVVIIVDYELKHGIERMHIVIIKVNKSFFGTLIYGSHFGRTICICSFEKSQTFIA
jgi:hypothetical protein